MGGERKEVEEWKVCVDEEQSWGKGKRCKKETVEKREKMEEGN